MFTQPQGLCLVMCVLLLKGSAEIHYTLCPDLWMAYEGSCYLFGTGKPMSFFEAEHYCRQHSGHLVHVETAEENAFLKDHIRTNNHENYWLGLTDEGVEGIWEWYDTNSKPNYTDWHPGEPNSFNHHDEDCAHFRNESHFDFQWNDASCDFKCEPLCEIREEEPVGIIG